MLPALLAAPFSAIGATVNSLSPTRQAAIRDGLSSANARAISRFLDNRDKIMTRWIVLRVGGVSATAAMLGQGLSGWNAWAWVVGWGAAVSFYALPSELLRRLMQPRAEGLFPGLLRFARLGEWCVAPIADPIFWIAHPSRGEADPQEGRASLTETEVEMLVNEGELNGALDHDQSEMIRNVLDFGEVTAEELMVPRTQIDALEAETTVEGAFEEVTRTQHSRYPIYTDSTDNIVGILHVKDLFHAMVHDKVKNRPLLDLARKPVPFVAEGQLASTVLKDMRAGRHHMAVVLDEFGGVSGILTLEDLLEEIVGDIQDEHDQDDAARIVMIEEHTARVDASTPISDINRTIGTELPEGDYVSLGGLLVEHLGRVPKRGTTVDLHGLKVVIIESDERHVAQVELSEVPGEPPDPNDRSPASAA